MVIKFRCSLVVSWTLGIKMTLVEKKSIKMTVLDSAARMSATTGCVLWAFFYSSLCLFLQVWEWGICIRGLLCGLNQNIILLLSVYGRYLVSGGFVGVAKLGSFQEDGVGTRVVTCPLCAYSMNFWFFSKNAIGTQRTGVNIAHFSDSQLQGHWKKFRCCCHHSCR